MGTFERIRKTSPYILGLFVLVFVAYMVVSDMGNTAVTSRNNNPSSDPVVTINGEDVIYAYFESEVESRIEDQRLQNEASGQADAEVDDRVIKQGLWQETINNVITSQECKKAGITVTDNEVLDKYMESFPQIAAQIFGDTNTADLGKRLEMCRVIVSDPNRFLNEQIEKIRKNNPNVPDSKLQEFAEQIGRIRKFLVKFEMQIPDQQRRSSLQTLVNTASSMISPLFARNSYINDNSSARVDMFFFDPKKILDTLVNVSDQEMKDYYEKHKKNYKQKPSRKVRYVAFAIAPSTEDSVKTNRTMNSLQKDFLKAITPGEKDTLFSKKFSEYEGVSVPLTSADKIDRKLEPYLLSMKPRDVQGPLALQDGYYFLRLEELKDSADNVKVSASHILFKFAPDKNKDSLMKEAKKVLAMAKKPGANFAELAMKYSEDGSAQSGGDLGFFGKGQMVKPFEEACFKTDSGKVTGIVESEFGYHIIKVTGKKTEKSYAYSYIKLAPKIYDATKKALKNQTQQFKRQVEEGADFMKLAAGKGLKAEESPFLEKEQPLINSYYFTALAFETEKGEILDPSLTISDDEKVYYVIQVTDSRNAGITPFEDMKDMLKAKVRFEKKLNQLMTDAKAFYGKVSGTGSLASVKAIDSTRFRSLPDMKNNGTVSGIGQDFILTTKAFTVPVNKVIEPFIGEKGVYIIQVNNRNIPSDPNSIAQGTKEKMKAMRESTRSNAFYSWFKQVMDDSEILDYRISKWRMRF